MKFSKAKFIYAYNNVEKFPTLDDVARYLGVGLTTIKSTAQKLKSEKVNLIDRMTFTQKQKEEAQQKIVAVYLDVLKKKGMRPVSRDLFEAGVSHSRVRRVFKSFDNLTNHVRKQHPDVFGNIADESLFTRKAFSTLQTEAKKYNRFIITTAVVGCKVDEDLLKSIDLYCEENDALPLFLLAADPAANVGWNFDAILKDRNIVFDDLALNKSLFISTIKLSAKHIDPITGLKRIGQRNGSFIYASPKQRMKPVANSPAHHPIVLMTTGAVTKPNYNTDRYMSERTAYIADNDHVMGGIIIELEDDGKAFHFRQFQADKHGGFADLGKFYSPQDGIFDYSPEAIKTGDWHTWWTNQDAKRCWFEATEELGISTFIVDDVFDGTSISHHDRKNKVRLAQKAIAGKTNLESEVKAVAQELKEITELKPVQTLLVTPSNHNNFLYRYLCEGVYVDDPENHRYALDLAKEAIDGRDPLKFAIQQTQIIEYDEKVVWLEQDQEYKIDNVEVGQHGDIGSDGSYASVNSLENSYGNCVVGHTHSPEILRGVWRVGTTSELRLPYTKGTSSWMHTSCLIYPNGMRQLINVINGKWRRED